jgi:protein gp37
MGEHTASKIDDHTMNFWCGCQRVSEGCDHCYARMAHDHPTEKQERHAKQHPNFGIVRHGSASQWADPPSWQKSAAKAHEVRLVFTCSYSDFFHPDADQWRPKAWAIINNTPNLIWRILTKRPELIEEKLPSDWGNGYPNVWLGVTVESKKYLLRMDTLRKIPAAVRYLCAEPLLEDLTPDIEQHLDGFSWLMVGGESGCGTNNYRPFNLQWARNLRDLCKQRSIPFYFKQISARWTQTGATIDGIEHYEFPAAWDTYKPAPKVRVPGQVQLLDADLNVV